MRRMYKRYNQPDVARDLDLRRAVRFLFFANIPNALRADHPKLPAAGVVVYLTDIADSTVYKVTFGATFIIEAETGTTFDGITLNSGWYFVIDGGAWSITQIDPGTETPVPAGITLTVDVNNELEYTAPG